MLMFSSVFLFALLNLLNLANSESFIGVNYGQVADNLPSPAATAKLLQSTSIEKVRLYGTDPAIIQALANTGIGIVIGAANGDIPAFASDPNFAKNWVNGNVVPFYPASNIIVIMVGNEVLMSGDNNLITQLLPAMKNIQSALDSVSLGDKIKVSTVHSMTLLRQSEPPSSARFHPNLINVLKELLGFNNATGSPFAINPYPYFAYRGDNRAETLAFCLFQPNSGRYDPNTKINYMNMFDAQVDAIHSALDSMGFKNVEIVVAETGWPYKGDSNEVGPSVDNAKAYNGGLIEHLRSKVGTPLMPGKSVDTYLFALYDEDLKPGPTSERSFGLFNLDLTMTYDIGLSKNAEKTPVTPATPKTPVTPATQPAPNPSPKPNKSAWCVPKADVSEAQLQSNLDYVCGHGFDCTPIQPGGACFEPNTLVSHATYAMNLLYQTSGRNPWNCDFSQTATISSKNPTGWDHIPFESLSRVEQRHVSDAWLVSPERRHVDILLDDRRLHELGFIVTLSEARRRKVEKTLSKKRKLTVTVKERMADKGKTVPEKSKKRKIPRGPRLIAEDEALEQVSPLRTTRTNRSSVSIAEVGGSSQVPEGIPINPVVGELDPEVPVTVEVVDSSDRDGPPGTPRAGGSRDSTFSPNYFITPPAQSSGSKPINPETGVQYLCAYGKDLLKSGEVSGYGKMSNVDRIRHGQANMWQAIGNLLHMERRYGDAKAKCEKLQKDKEKVEEKLRESRALVDTQRTIISETSGAYQKAKAACRVRHAKVCDYRERIKRANATIRGMKKDLGENAVDRYVNSEDFYEVQEQSFDGAVEDVRKLLGRSYPEFDFSLFDAEVEKAVAARVKPTLDPVTDISENFLEEPVSEEEPEVVSSDDESLIPDKAPGRAKRVRRG